VIGTERKTEVLGSGAFSTVSAEWDSLLGHAVAVKEISSPFAQNEAFTRAFLAKARRLFDLDHEHVLAIHRIDLNRQAPALIRELGEETLETLLLAGPQSPEKAEEILRHALLGLRAMHARGVIHGAIKPQNIFRCGERFKIGDFGVDGAPPSALSRFAAPESLRGEPAAAGSDLFSLGMVVYALLLGKERFEQLSRIDLAPVDELVPGSSRPLAAAVEQMTRKALAYRAASVDQILETLNAAGVTATSSVPPTLGMTALDARLRPEAPKPTLDIEKLKVILAILAAVLVVGLGVWAFLYLRGQAPSEHPALATPPVAAKPETSAQPAGPAPVSPAVSKDGATPSTQPEGSTAVPTAPVQESAKPPTFPAPAPPQNTGAVISQAPEGPPTPSPASEETTPAKKIPSAGVLIHELRPGFYTLGSLHSGQRAYMDFDAVFADVPGRHDRLPCIRYKDGGISFELTQDAKVYIGHDETIKRKPGWLQSFQRTGDSWSALARDAAGSEVLKFDVYERSYRKGSVNLGPNTEKETSLFKNFGKIVGKREPGMYLVCIDPQ
jgi:serine/threonine-protein kinase